MGKNSTKCAGNVFYDARYNASSCNDRLGSREGASEETGIDRTRIARIETGTLDPYPDEVILMGCIYNAPELENKYCSTVCPIGKKKVPVLELNNADRAVLNFMAAYIDLKRGEGEIEDLVVHAAELGTISENAMPTLRRIMERASALSVRTQELVLWSEKNKTK